MSHSDLDIDRQNAERHPTMIIAPIPAEQHGAFTPHLVKAIADYVISTSYNDFGAVVAVLTMNGANDDQVSESIVHINRMIDELTLARREAITGYMETPR